MKPKIIYGAGINLSGLWGPYKMSYYKALDEYFDKSGDCSIKQLGKHQPHGDIITFASTTRKETILWVRGVKATMKMRKSLVKKLKKLLRPRIYHIRIYKTTWLKVTMQWLEANEVDVKFDIISRYHGGQPKNMIFLETLPIRINLFNRTIKLFTEECDEFADSIDDGSPYNKQSVFEDILEESQK